MRNSKTQRAISIAAIQALEQRTLLSSSIAGVLYNDLNSNGKKDTGEAGLSGWTVFLDANHNGKLDPGEKTTTTLSTGAYSFTGLAAGNYAVGEVVPTGWKETTKTPGGTVGIPALHDYELNGTFADAEGGPALITGGGTLSSTGYTFAIKQGLNVSKAAPVDNYSIELLVTLNTLSGYEKLIDFKNRTADAGVYALNNTLVFYQGIGSTGVAFTLGKPVDVVITRNSSTKQVTGYANGVQEFTFTDTSSLATFSSTNAIAWFLQDDLGTNHEYPTGFLNRLQIFNNVLTAAQVKTLTGGGFSVPTTEYLVKLTASQAVTGINFGNVKPVIPPTNLKGVVFKDTNGNGIKDTGEAAIANAVVFIDTNHNGKLDTGEKSMKTAADGSYDFVGLAAGSYNIGVVKNTGYAITAPKITGAFVNHDYALVGKLSDSFAGPSLVSGGGTISSSGYAFPVAKGLSLSGALSVDNYSIELNFKLDDVSGFRKIIDFKNRTADAGLYVLNGVLDFYQGAAGTTATIANGKFVDVILTRNSSTKVVTGYVNGIQQFTFVDSSALATFSSPAAIAWFFDDDLVTNHEYGTGTVKHIRTFAAALTAAQAKTVGTGGAPPIAIQDYTKTLAAGQTISGLNFGEKQIV